MSSLPGCNWDIEAESAVKSLLLLFMVRLAALVVTLMHHPGSFQASLIPSMTLIQLQFRLLERLLAVAQWLSGG